MTLSKAEQNVAVYIEMGKANREIADLLCVAEKTVKFHITSIFKKSGVTSRSEYIALKAGTTINRKECGGGMAKDLETGARPLEQGARAVQVIAKTQENKVQFINETFKVGESIDHMHKLMKDVTKTELTPSTVNAACNCVARINETINTAISAAKFLNER